MSKKASFAEKLASDMQKKYPSAVLMNSKTADGMEVFSTGLAVLDRWVLEIGGIPWGRMVEMYGQAGAGKDTISNRMMAGAQADGAQVVLLDTERKWDKKWAILHGVDTDQLLRLQPKHTEEAHQMIENLVKRSSPKRRMLIILNSLAATPCQKEVDEGMEGKDAMGVQARLWSKFSRVITSQLAEHEATLIIINQPRNKIGILYGDPTTTPGGEAVKCHSYLRLSVMHGKYEPNKTGRLMKVMAMKNQLCAPMRTAELKLDFTQGFDEKWSILNHGKEMGCISAKCQSLPEALTALGWDLKTSVVENEAEEGANEEAQETTETDAS